MGSDVEMKVPVKKSKNGAVVKSSEVHIPARQHSPSKQSVFDVIKDSGEPVIAVLTAAVAVVFFAWRIMVYMYDISYLFYWEIDATYIPYFTPQGAFAATILFSLALYLTRVSRGGMKAGIYSNDSGLLGVVFVEAIFLCLYFMIICRSSSWLEDGRFWAIICNVIPFLGDRYYFVCTFALLCEIAAVVSTRLLAVMRKKLQNANIQASKENTPDQANTESDAAQGKSIFRKAITSITLCVVIFSLVVFLMAILGAEFAASKKNLPVVSYVVDDMTENYAIIYQAEDKAVMLACEINEENVIYQVHHKIQKVVSLDGLEYEIMDYVPKAEQKATEPTEVESVTEEPTE